MGMFVASQAGRSGAALVTCLSLCSISFFAFSGCGGGDDRERLETIPVEGRLLIDGKPYGPVHTIGFSPVNPGAGENPRPGAGGRVAEDGTFELTTYDEGDGIPEGTYNVTLTADPIEVEQTVPATKPHQVEIKRPEGGVLKLEVSLESDPSRSPDDPTLPGGTPPPT